MRGEGKKKGRGKGGEKEREVKYSQAIAEGRRRIKGRNEGKE